MTEAAPAGINPSYAEFDVLEVGWPFRPFRCVAAEYRRSVPIAGPKVLVGADLDGEDERPWYAPHRRGGSGIGISVAPSKIVVPAFLANSVLFGVGIASLYLSPRAIAVVVAIWRRRRGMCPLCGYDLSATSGACPECGAALVARGRP